jgi:hypothetical protein
MADDRRKFLLVYDPKTSTVDFTDIDSQESYKHDGMMLVLGLDDRGNTRMVSLGNIASLANSFAQFATDTATRKLYGLIGETCGKNGIVLGCQECDGSWGMNDEDSPKTIN